MREVLEAMEVQEDQGEVKETGTIEAAERGGQHIVVGDLITQSRKNNMRKAQWKMVYFNLRCMREVPSALMPVELEGHGGKF